MVTGLGEITSAAMAMEQDLRRELEPGERLIWSARPDAARLKLPFLIWLFAVPWTAFALFWTSLAAMPLISRQPLSGAPDWIMWLFPLFGLPFILIGLKMLSLPFTMRADARHRMFGLTSKRIIRLTTRKSREVESVPLDKLGTMNRREKPDGWGTLTITKGHYIDSDGDRRADQLSIDWVPDVARVERMILEAKSNAGKG